MGQSLRTGQCLNCSNTLQGNFCNECGQKASTDKITLKETIQNFLSSAFSLEGPLLKTIFLLFKNPGKVFREYIAGKRKTYFQPVPFYLLMTALYLIVRALLNFDPLEGQTGIDQAPQGQGELSIEAARFMSNNINNIMFFLIFSIAFMLKLFFRKHNNLAEYISIGLFICGLYTLIGIITMVISTFTFPGFNRIQIFVMLLLIIYCTSSYFNSFKFLAITKYFLVGFFSIILYMTLGYGFSFLIVSMG